MTYQLGIDTGGTYTDAVIINEAKEILASNKSLTTAFDLSVGIGNAIGSMPAELLANVDLVALSTTLSTNSVVEGRGAPVAVLLPGFNQKQLDKSGISKIISSERTSLLRGGHDAMGNEQQALDLQEVEEAIFAHNDKVSAFAVSAMFGARNTSHELEVRDLVVKLTGKPVACGHELASSLGAPRRALTATLNARMIPFIQMLMESLKSVLSQYAITAPLMIVKGDGSLINVGTAELQPVATVLSGPAASVLGACSLSGESNALVVDIGGTTTDIAVVREGSADLCDDGARIGDWQPMVEAIRAYSIGLGGDSEIRFDGKMSISTRRVVPVSLLVHQYPHLLASLKRQMKALSNPRHNRFALRLQRNQVLIDQLSREDLRAWKLLEAGPLDIDNIAEDDRPLTRAVARLERMGLAIYSGFTPSDASHVLGLSHHWSTEAAELAAQLWARQMRYLYGCGDWSLDDAKGPSEAVFSLVTDKICHKLIEAGLNQHGLLNEARAKNLASLLCEVVLTDEKHSALFTLDFASGYPLIGVGGPSSDFLPAVAKKLGMQLVLPEHGSTANAYGAVMASVVQRVSVTVTQPRHGEFYVFHGNEPMTFKSLDSALLNARKRATDAASQLAKAAGAIEVSTRLEETREHVNHDIDGELFVSAIVTAVAVGKPGIY
ncbi:MAG: hydantoinase/oxoprolinase N-terminal domain-containing protein [Granulosicoccus sp.]